jgi:YebC/PmpR family DNA-binding regulatory protein
MGRGWVNAVREAAGAKKGKLFTKIAREIAVAVKMGGDNPEGNARLRMILKEARENSMPRDTIDRAVKRGLGVGSEAAYEEVVYEGYGPFGVAALVEVLTDNRNRTVQELRALFVRSAGNLGEAGSVQWMFDKISSVIAVAASGGVDPEEVAINAGANEVDDLGEGQQFQFVGDPSDLDVIQKGLTEQGWKVLKAEMSYRAKNPIAISEAQEGDLKVFLDKLEDLDDVKRVHLSI